MIDREIFCAVDEIRIALVVDSAFALIVRRQIMPEIVISVRAILSPQPPALPFNKQLSA